MAFGILRKKEKSNRFEKTASVPERKKIGGNLSFQASEAYKLLRTNLSFSLADKKGCKVIGYTSSLRGEGKSLSALNTAYSFAVNGKKVLIVEGDFRRPSLGDKLELDVSFGVTDFLINRDTKIDKAIFTIEASNGVAFDIAVSGSIPPNPSELLDSDRMKEFMDLCCEKYDIIILDLPPVTAVADAVITSKLVDGMVVVVRHDYCDEKSIAETIRQLKFVNTKILGFVFNAYSANESGYYKKYKKYYKNDYVKNNAYANDR